MTIGVGDGLIWVGLRQFLTSNLTVNVVLGAAIGSKVRSLMNKRPALGIGTSGGGAPEARTEVDGSELIGI